MHIEPGVIPVAKLIYANSVAAATLLLYSKDLVQKPADWLRTSIAALFFSLFMQAFHLSVGPSELHFVGAMTIYLTLGFLPTMFGFAVGLLLQGLLFEPQDLPHLAVNSLSLIVPLIAVHTLRRHTTSLTNDWRTILKLDAIYYSGVIAMVGFWLALGNEPLPLLAWLKFAVSYTAIVVTEPLVTITAITLISRYRKSRLVMLCTDINGLHTSQQV